MGFWKDFFNPPVSDPEPILKPEWDSFFIPSGYEFDRVVVTQTGGRQIIEIKSKKVEPVPPTVLFDVSLEAYQLEAYDQLVRAEEPPF